MEKIFAKSIKLVSVLIIVLILFIQSSVFAISVPGSMTVSAKSTYAAGESIVFNWTASSGATKYGLSVWKEPYGNDQYLVFDNYVTGTSKNIGSLPAGKYCVQMKPYNSAGGGPNSNVVYFTVQSSQPTVSVPGSMTVTAKSTYAAGESIVFNWTASSGAAKYGLSVWKEPYGNDQYLVFDNYVTGTSKNIGSLPAGKYCVQMKPYNSAGGGPNSNVVYFTVQSSQPTVTVPGSMTVSAKSTYAAGESVVFNWTASSGATKYGLSVWKEPYGNDQYLVFDNYVTGTSKNIGSLPAGKYCVQMKPYNSAGGGPNSNVVYFTVQSSQPTVTVPGSMTVSAKSTYAAGESVVFNWTASSGAAKYGLSVWKEPYGNDQYLVFDNYVTGTSKNIGSLPAGRYCVQMKPYNSAGGGPNSNVVYFTVYEKATMKNPLVQEEEPIGKYIPPPVKTTNDSKETSESVNNDSDETISDAAKESKNIFDFVSEKISVSVSKVISWIKGFFNSNDDKESTPTQTPKPSLIPEKEQINSDVPEQNVEPDLINERIAEVAETYANGTWGGQCKAFVNSVVSKASDGKISVGNGYQNAFARAGGIEINPQDAVRGDIIQVTPAGSDGSSVYDMYDKNDPSKQLHTAIILSNSGGGNFWVIDSNTFYSKLNPVMTPELVFRHSYNPYSSAAGSIIKIWRLN
ncbi:CHAP domain-containing protein [Alkalibacter rhizosphaerae]|uniref:CHAP domain-containing protein n=1 Tax=Alkalibacter rhizosphaerae TaxID=2815577 RepID=A0A974XGI9_9FIRM|nr:CHAP domain-containing protein [Alkalibacter rhizosphaerae]QSX08225.1 CHAP domain-containing protein [Alkalibacter rhizosphaerae]